MLDRSTTQVCDPIIRWTVNVSCLRPIVAMVLVVVEVAMVGIMGDVVWDLLASVLLEVVVSYLDVAHLKSALAQTLAQGLSHVRLRRFWY